jgi:hypothetical protein
MPWYRFDFSSRSLPVPFFPIATDSVDPLPSAWRPTRWDAYRKVSRDSHQVGPPELELPGFVVREGKRLQRRAAGSISQPETRQITDRFQLRAATQGRGGKNYFLFRGAHALLKWSCCGAGYVLACSNFLYWVNHSFDLDFLVYLFKCGTTTRRRSSPKQIQDECW